MWARIHSHMPYTGEVTTENSPERTTNPLTSGFPFRNYRPKLYLSGVQPIRRLVVGEKLPTLNSRSKFSKIIEGEHTGQVTTKNPQERATSPIASEFPFGNRRQKLHLSGCLTHSLACIRAMMPIEEIEIAGQNSCGIIKGAEGYQVMHWC